MSDTPKPPPPPLWSPGGTPGIWHATLNGRAWTLTEPTGSTAWAAYVALQGRLAALGMYGAERVKAAGAAIGFAADPDVQRLARQTVDWMTCDGVPVASAFDRLFPASRVAEVPALAREAWMALGFFTFPGDRPGAKESPTAAPTPAPTPGAV